MKIHCLGTTGFHPSPTRHTACYYLPDQEIVLDAGTGIFRLVQHLLDKPKKSLSLLLSHAHLDHVIGLTFLIDALAVTQLERVELIGDAEKLEAVREHLYHPLLFPVAPSMEFVPLPSESGSMRVGTSEVSWFPLEHPGNSLGYCISNGDKKLSYVTDTVARPNASYIKAIGNSDLLMHECYFGDDAQEFAATTGHSWLAAVTDIVEQVKPKRTALIHINPLAEIMKTGFKLSEDQEARLNMFVAEDEMQIEV